MWEEAKSGDLEKIKNILNKIENQTGQFHKYVTRQRCIHFTMKVKWNWKRIKEMYEAKQTLIKIGTCCDPIKYLDWQEVLSCISISFEGLARTF